MGCNWHEKNPARQGGKGCRLSLPGQPAFMRAYRIRGARGFLLGSDALCMGCISHMDSPARQGGKGCRLSLPRARRTGEARKSMRVQPAGLSLRRKEF